MIIFADVNHKIYKKMTTEVKANLFNHARNHVREMSDVIMKCSGIMKQRIVLILATLLFGSIYAQDSVRPVYYDYNYIELCLSFKDSCGKQISFIHNSSDSCYFAYYSNIEKKYKLCASYNQYRLGSCGPKDIPEMEEFYRNLYNSLNDDDCRCSNSKRLFTEYLISGLEFFSINNSTILPGNKYNPSIAERYMTEYGTTNNNAINSFQKGRYIFYRYAASDNVVYDPTDLLGERLVETPYFVPIGYLEVFFVEDNKLMHIDFEMYDYNKLGISRQSYELDSTKLNIIDLSIEIQFQEGEFVITDESYPNLIPKRKSRKTKY